MLCVQPHWGRSDGGLWRKHPDVGKVRRRRQNSGERSQRWASLTWTPLHRGGVAHLSAKNCYLHQDFLVWVSASLHNSWEASLKEFQTSRLMVRIKEFLPFWSKCENSFMSNLPMSDSQLLPRVYFELSISKTDCVQVWLAGAAFVNGIAIFAVL